MLVLSDVRDAIVIRALEFTPVMACENRFASQNLDCLCKRGSTVAISC